MIPFMAKDQALIDAEAARLRQVRLRRGYKTATDAARAFGWVKSTYLAHENGTRGYKRSDAKKYAMAFRVAVSWLLNGEAEPATLDVVRHAPVVGEAAAGVWREEDVWDVGKYPDVPVASGYYSSLPQKAFRVSGSSVDLLRIFDGDFVICVDYWEVRTSPQDRDIVVVLRRQGALVERTVKQIVVKADVIELWPRSTDPRYAEPLIVPREHDTDGGSSVEIEGLVIGGYRDFLAGTT